MKVAVGPALGLACAFGLSLAACAVPLTTSEPAAQGALAGAGQSRQVQPIAATETAARPTVALTATAEFGAPPPTPLAATATPLPPPLPTLTLPPRPPLDAASQAAFDAVQATAAARAASATGTAAALPAQEIVIKDLAFSPTSLAVPPGTTVVWRNLDQVLHQVRGGEFDSGRIQSGGYWASILNRPGVYQFLCSFHPTMRAEITVASDDSRPIHLGT
jgi:plastocyanin